MLLYRGTCVCNRGTQRIILVNHLFGRPLIPPNFLTKIVISNFCDMRNLMSVVFGLLKRSVWVPKERSAIIFRKVIRVRLKVFGNIYKQPLINLGILKFHYNNRTDKKNLAQPKINLQSFKSTPDSLKLHLKAFERKWSLGAPDAILHTFFKSSLTYSSVVWPCSKLSLHGRKPENSS